MNSSSENTKSLFSKWKQDRAKLAVIFDGPFLSFGFECFVINVSDKGIVTFAELATPSEKHRANMLVQFRLEGISSMSSVDPHSDPAMPEELRPVVETVTRSWAFTLKSQERLVIHQKAPTS